MVTKNILSAVIKLGLALLLFVFAVARIMMGYVPSSRRVKYPNITAAANPVSFWITIAVMLIAAVVLLILGVASLLKTRRQS